MYNNHNHKNSINLFYFNIKKFTVNTGVSSFLLNLFIFKNYLENVQNAYSFILYFYSYINMMFLLIKN